MNLEEISNRYVLSDGQVLSFQVSYEICIITINLKVRRNSKKNNFESCIIKLEFKDAIEFNIFEDFGTSTNYSDITFNVLDNGIYYISLDPFDNSGIPNNKDNFVIKSKSLTLIDETETSHTIHSDTT